MTRIHATAALLAALLLGCEAGHEPAPRPQSPAGPIAVHPEAGTLEGRFSPPAGHSRTPAGERSFAAFLRALPLKAAQARVLYFDGREKTKDVYVAVVDLDVGDRDLQQCADAVIRLRAEYLFKEGLYPAIRFDFTNGFQADYSRWRAGDRIAVKGNSVRWVKSAAFSADYQTFRSYLDMVFTYAGTLSLSRELAPAEHTEMRIGDVFIQGGSPGHCVLVVDMAEKRETGEKVFMLAQGYMPAQHIQILRNPALPLLSPGISRSSGRSCGRPNGPSRRATGSASGSPDRAPPAGSDRPAPQRARSPPWHGRAAINGSVRCHRP